MLYFGGVDVNWRMSNIETFSPHIDYTATQFLLFLWSSVIHNNFGNQHFLENAIKIACIFVVINFSLLTKTYFYFFEEHPTRNKN